MTKREFIEQINDWADLLSLCNDEVCDVCDDIFDQEELDRKIKDDLTDAMSHQDWKQIADMLASIPIGYDHYLREGPLSYCGLDDGADFNTYKDRVFAWMESYDFFEADLDGDDEAVFFSFLDTDL